MPVTPKGPLLWSAPGQGSGSRSRAQLPPCPSEPPMQRPDGRVSSHGQPLWARGGERTGSIPEVGPMLKRKARAHLGRVQSALLGQRCACGAGRVLRAFMCMDRKGSLRGEGPKDLRPGTGLAPPLCPAPLGPPRDRPRHLPPWRTFRAAASPSHCAGAAQGADARAGNARHSRAGRALSRSSYDMATALLRRVASAVGPLLQLGGRPLSALAPAPLRAGPAARAPPGLIAALLTARPVLGLQPALGFKTKGVLKKRCKGCYLVKRRGRWFVYCKTNPKHKQRQM
ncbi:39S ribosomal protein L36, mitochondrial [Cervus canadensis]|uniref:39S ribosomal protein L36, mitochondrial n=1 Tax=Cervus canadensis TaxID=1574408 RepID=UPI001C9E4FC4|nr:39S ribosomal protein L36, mitochondrial [Cervus canadensis]